jgi:putative chitinase
LTLISIEQFKEFLPHSGYANLAPALDAAAHEFGIDTNKEIRHWLAQITVESGYFQTVAENLNYSAERLHQVWHHRFPTVASAKPYEHNARALGNFVYANRLGNTHEGDGYLYRGRGFIQITGRDNYQQAARALQLDVVANPDLVCNLSVAAKTAAWFWKSHNLDAIVALHEDESSICRKITEVINGGDNGLEDRKKVLQHASTIWKDF